MIHVGYSLVDAQGAELQSWSTGALPQMIVLPNGDHVHCPTLGALQNWQCVERWVADDKPPFRDLLRHDVALVDGKVVATAVYADADLPAVKATLSAQVDAEAETARLRYITAGSGQDLEYRKTAEEAARYVATQGAGTYPMLQASVSAGEAADLAAAAALISQREAAWATVGAQIRQLRIAAKRGIAAAGTVEQAMAAATVAWP